MANPMTTYGCLPNPRASPVIDCLVNGEQLAHLESLRSRTSSRRWTRDFNRKSDAESVEPPRSANT